MSTPSTPIDIESIIARLFESAGTPRASRILDALDVLIELGADPVAMMRMVRIAADLGLASQDTAIFVAVRLFESVWMHGHDPQLRALSDEIDAIERREGLDPAREAFRIGEGPLDWQAANRRFEERLDAILEQLLRDGGAGDWATLHRRAPRRWDAHEAAGARVLLPAHDDDFGDDDFEELLDQLEDLDPDDDVDEDGGDAGR